MIYSGKKKKMRDGGKLKMVTNAKGEEVPFYAADGKGKMMGGGRVEYNTGGYASIQDMEKHCGSKVSYNTMK